MEITFTDWQQVLVYLITILIGFLGVPLTQWFKVKLKIEDKSALVLTGGIALCLALLQTGLSGQVDFMELDISTLPAIFGIIFTSATFYYGLLKGAKGVLGQKFMIRPPK